MLPKQRPQSKPPLLQKSVDVMLVPSDEAELVGSEDEPVADVGKVLEPAALLVSELDEQADSSP